jgi:hypothetical protein
MNNVTEVMPFGSAVSRGAILRRLFVIGYGVAMVGWVSAFGWLIVKVAKWLLA